MKDAYLQMLFANFIRSPKYDKLFGEGWVAAEEIAKINEAAFLQAFESYDLRVVPASFFEIFLGVFDEVLSGGGIVSEGDEFTGIWYKINAQEKSNIVKRSLSQNPAAQRLNNLGETAPIAYRNALGRIVAEGLAEDGQSDDATDQDSGPISEAPASDRIVTFDHNSPEACEVLDLTEEASEAIRGSNSIEEEQRSWIREHISAGVEFIRRHKKVLTGAIEALLLKPLRAAYDAVAEEPAKAAILAAIKAIKTMFGL